MAFYYIQDSLHSPDTTTSDLLIQSCKERGIEAIWLDPVTFHEASFSKLTPSDLLYRISTQERSKTLESFLLLGNPTTFYANPQTGLFRSSKKSLVLKYHGLPVPKTIYTIPQDKKHLQECVEALGGFPIIVKAQGGSHGVGVMKVDSLESLSSVVDYVSQDSSLVLRQFIRTTSSIRCIVLGNRVVDSIAYQIPKNDFRSNIGEEPIVQAQTFSKEIEDVAIKAVNVLGLEFGGVDILLDPEGKPYILETNFPCYFPRAQQITGTDISGMMIEHLLKKSQHTVSTTKQG